MSKGHKFFLVFCVITNLFPLFGIFFLGWNPFSIFFIYLGETILMVLLGSVQLLLKMFITREFYIFSAFPVFALCIFLLFLEILFVIGLFLFSGNIEPSFWFIKKSISETKIWIFLIILEHILYFLFSLKREYYISLNDTEVIKTIFKRTLFAVLAIIGTFFVGSVFEENPMLISAALLLLIQGGTNIILFIFSLKSPQKTLPL